MKILFYLGAGNGDLINFTGLLKVLKITHHNYQFDILIPKRHLPLIENHPSLDHILFFEDYPDIPPRCTHGSHDHQVLNTFKNKYHYVLNAWGCKVDHPSKNDGDYIKTMFNLMKQYGFVLPYERADLTGQFYYSYSDYTLINDIAKTITKPLIVIENESRSWESPQIQHLNKINDYLLSHGYMTAGNGTEYSIDLNNLNLKQVKLLFDTCAIGFLGLSSGMSCAIYTRPNDYINKIVCISGLYDGWDIRKHLECKQTFHYFHNPYTVEDIKILFKDRK